MMWLFFFVNVLLLQARFATSDRFCEAEENVDYSSRTLSILGFDSRSRNSSETKMRAYGRRFGVGVKEIIVLGLEKNKTWMPLRVGQLLDVLLLCFCHQLFSELC